MWSVIQHRWIIGSNQNGENEIWRGSRVREARGQAKHNLHSHLEMLEKHDFFLDGDWEVDEENCRLEIWEWGAKVYEIRYEVREVDESE